MTGYNMQPFGMGGPRRLVGPGNTPFGPTTSPTYGATPWGAQTNATAPAPAMPAPTDYMGGAIAQGQANNQATQQTNVASRVNQNTPFGSQNFTFNPATGQWTSNISLDPSQQGLLNSQNAQSTALAGLGTKMAGDVSGSLSTPFSLGGAPPISGAADFKGQQDAAYKDLMARQNQNFDQQDQSLQARLANQGITAGSDAYNRAYQPLNQSRVDASNQADLASNSLAQNYIDRANQAHTMGVNDILTQRNQPLSELNAVRSGSQVTTPQFTQYSSAAFQPTPIQNAQALQNSYNTGQQNIRTGANNNMLNGLFSLGGQVVNSDWFNKLWGG